MADDLDRFFAEEEARGTRFLDPACDPPLGRGVKYDRNPILLAPDPTHHICHPQIVVRSDKLHLFYLHYDEQRPPAARLALATSRDGLRWERYGGNPILAPTPGAWDSWRTGYHSIVETSGHYHLYYSGVRKEDRGGWYGIGLATSTDLMHWEKHPGNPVLEPTGTGFESLQTQVPCVIIDRGTWYLYYLGQDGPTGHIGLATSKDGICWNRYGSNPVLKRDESSWDSLRLSPQTVLKYGDRYFMFYNGYDGDIYSSAVAISDDLIRWEKYEGNPTFTVDRPSSWESVIVDHQFCMPFRGKYTIWYSAADDVTQHIGLAFLAEPEEQRNHR